MDDRGRVRDRSWGGVAGCSGNNAAPSGPANPAPADPAEPTDPAPDEGTEAQKSFDKAYDDAKMALDEAVKAVESAEALADAAATAEDRAAARKALSDAQDDLAAALEAARELPVPTDDRRRGLRVGLVSDAEDAQRAQNERIEDAQASIQWSAGEGLVRLPVPAALPEVGVVRRHRMNAAGSADTPDLVDHESFPALPYEPGKVLISEGAASSGDPLPMRGFFPERIHDQSRSLGDSFGRDISYLNQNSDLTEYDFFHAGLRVTGTGLVIEMGGKGSDGTDLRRQVWLAPNTGPSSVHFDGTLPGNLDPWGWDLVLTFGEPTPSPEGNGERYWAARLMPDPGQIADGADATTRARYLVDGRPYRVGTYNLWLSNHAGADLGLEPVGPGETYPDDDVNSHLKYAAYGMMTFASSDRFERTTSLGAHIRDRVQAFHAGYDAFEDKSGRRTTDIREAVSGGKFTGLTIALELDRISGGNVNDYGAIDVPAARRLRGEVELTATISGAASNNAVKGRIRNLEVWDSRGYWKDYASIADDIALGSGSIDADGQYDGTITGVAGFGDGEYGGSFYGPVSDLETAGAWFLHGTNQGADAVHRAIVGSFGAKHAPQSK